MRCLCPSPQPGVSQPATTTATTRSPKEALPAKQLSVTLQPQAGNAAPLAAPSAALAPRTHPASGVPAH